MPSTVKANCTQLGTTFKNMSAETKEAFVATDERKTGATAPAETVG